MQSSAGFSCLNYSSDKCSAAPQLEETELAFPTNWTHSVCDSMDIWWFTSAAALSDCGRNVCILNQQWPEQTHCGVFQRKSWAAFTNWHREHCWPSQGLRRRLHVVTVTLWFVSELGLNGIALQLYSCTWVNPLFHCWQCCLIQQMWRCLDVKTTNVCQDVWKSTKNWSLEPNKRWVKINSINSPAEPLKWA